MACIGVHDVTVERCSFTDVMAPMAAGGALYVMSARTVNVTQSEFRSCSVGVDEHFMFHDCTSSPEGACAGGAVFVAVPFTVPSPGTDTQISDCSFEESYASGSGGAVAISMFSAEHASLLIEGSQFLNNGAVYSSGHVDVASEAIDPTVRVLDSTFVNGQVFGSEVRAAPFAAPSHE